MAMATKDLNGGIRAETPNSFMNESEGVGVISVSGWIVSNEKKEVNGLIKVDGIEKPLLLDHVCGLNDL